ncbi:MAG: hypothetical protein JSS40_18000 [Proteobacteria bacterium]|nr:hypothetical protein [Pseudomonadota bacterium]
MGSTVSVGNVYTRVEGEQPRHFRRIPENRRDVRRIVFGGFVRCCYPYQKFQSVEGELRLAIVLEDDPEVLRWMKPAPGQFRIEYDNGKPYEPDFIVETRTDILMIEPKRADQIGLPEVQAKARAATRWCHHASEHAAQHGSKPWRYLLVPDTAIDLAQSVAGLRTRWTWVGGQNI